MKGRKDKASNSPLRWRGGPVGPAEEGCGARTLNAAALASVTVLTLDPLVSRTRAAPRTLQRNADADDVGFRCCLD